MAQKNGWAHANAKNGCTRQTRPRPLNSFSRTGPGWRCRSRPLLRIFARGPCTLPARWQRVGHRCIAYPHRKNDVLALVRKSRQMRDNCRYPEAEMGDFVARWRCVLNGTFCDPLACFCAAFGLKISALWQCSSESVSMALPGASPCSGGRSIPGCIALCSPVDDCGSSRGECQMF